jgi:uncharacterized protein YciI
MWYLTWHRWTGDRQQALDMLDEHLAWMREHQETGEVIASGPTTDGEIGIIVFRSMTRERLDRLCATEPFVRSGFRDYDVYSWDVHQLLGVGPFTRDAVGAVKKGAGEPTETR